MLEFQSWYYTNTWIFYWDIFKYSICYLERFLILTSELIKDTSRAKSETSAFSLLVQKVLTSAPVY